MCTVSIVPFSDGFRLISNRDERRDRAAALQPSVEALGSRSIVMPIDPVGGGSWIGVNDAGLVAALLNRHHDPAALSEPLTSRGVIVRRALECDSVAAAVAAVRRLDARRFRPFRLVLAQKRQIALVGGDGRELADTGATLDRPLMFTASSLGDVLVDAPRRRLFECLMNDSRERRDRQMLFHKHQWTDKRDVSVMMERPDAATVSRTTVDVEGGVVALEYESLLPRCPARRLELFPC